MTNCPDNCKHYGECNYNKRYDYKHDGIVDYGTNKTIKSYKDISDLLNEKEELLQKMRTAFKQKYDYDIEEVIDEVYDDGDIDDWK